MDDDEILSVENQTTHILNHFANTFGFSTALFVVDFTEDETIEVRDMHPEPWVFTIPSDDDGIYRFVRGDVTISFPYPGE